MKNINYKAIIISNILDMLLSPVLGTIFMILVILVKGLYKLPVDDISKILVQMVHDGPMRYIIFLAGAIMSILAGYISAKISGKEYVKYGALSAILCTLGALYSIFTKSQMPLYVAIPLLFVSPLLGALGGYLYGRYKNR